MEFSSEKLSRDELRRKLRGKIDQKRITRVNGVSRKDANELSDKIESLVEMLKNENITVNTAITPDIVEKVLKILSITDLKKILARIQDNQNVEDNFKEFISKLLESV